MDLTDLANPLVNIYEANIRTIWNAESSEQMLTGLEGIEEAIQAIKRCLITGENIYEL